MADEPQKKPRLNADAIKALREHAEAAWAMAADKEDRQFAASLSALLDWHDDNARAATLALPPLDKDMIAILGRPNFACAGVAKILRKAGHKIESRAEDEQAAVIHWMLDLYFKHGPNAWSEVAEAEFKRMRDAAPSVPQ